MGIDDIYPIGKCTDNSVRHYLEQTVAQENLSYDGSWGSSLDKTSDGKKDKISVYAFSTSGNVQDTDERHDQIYF